MWLKEVGQRGQRTKKKGGEDGSEHGGTKEDRGRITRFGAYNPAREFFHLTCGLHDAYDIGCNKG